MEKKVSTTGSLRDQYVFRLHIFLCADIPTVPIPTSATNSESSGPKESSPTEIKELLRTSKTTENPAAVPVTSEKHSLIGLSSTLNTEELRTFEQQGKQMNANSKIVDEASIKEENGYSEVQDSLKRKTQLYSEVAPDEEGPTPTGKESVTRGFNIQTKTVPGVPLYGQIDKNKQKTENANGKTVSDTVLGGEDEYSEVQDAMKRKTQLYSEINSDEKESVLQIKGTMAHGSEEHPTKSFDTPLYGKNDKNKQKAENTK
ncbi:hypothetical protein BSL78_25370 [Apostichopus japonicus]|uniref:Uncharacterized protein n=1 Tax=Stichopus japonicus TaxID=307972 RepID=A0A2G8JPU9_STIJA|nr:hypothetical protein BSL78_25370 [Apostichopus japonicus]